MKRPLNSGGYTG